MLLRNLLLALGGLALLAGVALSIAWLSQPGQSPVSETVPVRPAILVAKQAVATGTLLRGEDIAWQEVGPGEIHPGHLVRGQVLEADFLGSVARRNFEAGEPLVASDLVKPNDRGFLAAVLRPGMRAVSMAVDASQSESGL